MGTIQSIVWRTSITNYTSGTAESACQAGTIDWTLDYARIALEQEMKIIILNVEEEEQFKQLVSFVQLKQYFKQGRQVLLTVGQ